MPNLPKSLPAKWNINKLLLPAKRYTYFKQWKDNSFDSSSKVHSAVNAWWMAECSMLVYDEQPIVEQTLKGIETFTKDGQLNMQWLDKGSTQGLILEADNFFLVVIRGTEFYSFADIIRDPIKKILGVAKDLLADVQLTMESIGGSNGAKFRAATGFLKEFDKVQPLIGEFIGSTDKPIFLTGHSLGAAIVTLLAFDSWKKNIAGLYTFGSPGVGDQGFVDEFERRGLTAINFRYVNGDDPVTKALPTFQHVGNEKKLIARRFFLSHRFPLNMLDHAPMYYVLKCWNLLVH